MNYHTNIPHRTEHQQTDILCFWQRSELKSKSKNRLKTGWKISGKDTMNNIFIDIKSIKSFSDPSGPQATLQLAGV